MLKTLKGQIRSLCSAGFFHNLERKKVPGQSATTLDLMQCRGALEWQRELGVKWIKVEQPKYLMTGSRSRTERFSSSSSFTHTHANKEMFIISLSNVYLVWSWKDYFSTVSISEMSPLTQTAAENEDNIKTELFQSQQAGRLVFE